MRKKRIQGYERKASVTNDLKDVKRFIGVSLSGGKADKACVTVVEFYPSQKKVFVTKLFERIKSEEFISADFKIYELISQYEKNIQSVAFDVPLSLPKCMTCQLKCPGYEICDLPEVKYIRNLYQEDQKKMKPKKIFTPYTQRCVEAFLSDVEPELDIQHALGANMAPLTARAHFLKRRLKNKLIEVFPKLTVWRLGLDMKLSKSNLKTYRNSVGGDQSRRIFIEALVEKFGVFIYQQDTKAMIDNYHAFDSFISAFTGYLKFIHKTEVRPKNFPKTENWIDFPQK